MKDIPGFEGIYAITSCGKVWSYRSKKFLKSKTKKSGYLEIDLSVDNNKKSYLIHRLVAMTYIPNPDGLPQVSHLDESRSNNYINNLAWTNAKENCNMPEHKRRKSEAHLNNAASRKIICVETDTIYPSLGEAGRQFNCSAENIRRACVDSSKTARGYHWRYCNELLG